MEEVNKSAVLKLQVLGLVLVKMFLLQEGIVWEVEASTSHKSAWC